MNQERSCSLASIVDELGFSVLYPAEQYHSVELYSGEVHRPGLQLSGFFDYFDPTRIQLIGKMEASYLSALTPEMRFERLNALFEQRIPALILCHDAEPCDEIFKAAEKNDTTILASDQNTSEVMSNLMRVTQRELAPSITRHGVLVEVYGIGVFITGESGVGKSETAIELLKRGHRLIADDAVELKVVDFNVVQGNAPALIRHYMELRGIGVIDVRQIFGVGSVKERQNIHLVVALEPWKEGAQYTRLGIDEQTSSILGVDIATLTIPVRPGRNLAVILEVAAMNQRQKHLGFNAARDLMNQLNAHSDEKVKKMKK